MIKIKEFMNYAEGFETALNNWLCKNQHIEIVDIKYSTYLEKDGNYYSCCIVIYKK